MSDPISDHIRQLRHERNAALFENHTLKALNEDLIKRNEQLSKELAALKSKAESKNRINE